jgi:protein-S-isoprenylcysteine O-methyltransferase Ste14
MLNEIWMSVMDPEKNALMKLPKIVRFQLMMVLSFLWSAIFCVMAGVIVWFPSYVILHVLLVIIGIFGTSWLFKTAKQSAPPPPKL